MAYEDEQVRVRFWITPEADKAVHAAAAKKGMFRTVYLQQVARKIINEHRPDRDTDTLFRYPTSVPKKYENAPGHALGYKGRWSRWVQAHFSAHTSVPFVLTQIAQETGDKTYSSLLRRYLADQLLEDLGLEVPMPKPISGHFAERAWADDRTG